MFYEFFCGVVTEKKRKRAETFMKPKRKKAEVKILQLFRIWWPLPDLNWGPSDYESPALTTELRGHMRQIIGDGVALV